MSLLNDVLRDLQIRGAHDLEPLTGLEPVAELVTPRGWRTYVLPALAALSAVFAVLLWRPAIEGQWLPSITGLTSETRAHSRSVVPIPPDAAHRSEMATAITASGVTPIVRRGSEDSAATGVRAPTVPEATPVVDAAGVADAAVIEKPSATTQAATAEDTVSVTDTSAHIEPESTALPTNTTVFRREPLDASARAATAVARGLTAMRGSDFSSAERLFREALAVDSGDGAVWGYLYSALVRGARMAAAEETLRQGLAAAKEPAPLAKLYARLLLDRGEKEAAVRVLRTHRPVPTSDTEYDAFLGALLQQLGRYAEAAEIYRALLSVDESPGPWWIGLGISEDGLGNRPDALSAFEHAQRSATLNPTLAKYARRRILELRNHE